MAQAHIGQEFLRQYCLRCLDLGIHLVINHHLAMHYEDMIKLFGPIYGWWLFAFERFNGMLEKVNHNGHDGGRMELTLLRNWVQTHLIYEYLISLPADAHDFERKFLDDLIKDEGRQRGSMMTQVAILRSEASAGTCFVAFGLGSTHMYGRPRKTAFKDWEMYEPAYCKPSGTRLSSAIGILSKTVAHLGLDRRTLY
jgi:hypothetical protein